MKSFQKILGVAFATTIMAFSMVSSVFAEGSLETSVDKNSCANGESFRLTINAQADEGSTLPPQITVEFNANRLSFDNCSSEYGGGGGGLVTINDTDVTIDFTTLSGGEANIDITAVLDEDSTDIQKSTVTISVDGEDTAAGTDGNTVSNTGVEEGTIDAGDGRVVQAVFADEFMPVLFHKATTSYQGETVECAQFDMGDMTLLFTTDAMGNDGKFKILAMDGSLSDFRMIQGIENRFIIVLAECEGEIPAGYTKAVLEWEGQALTAYMDINVASGNAEAFNGVMPSDFFLVYALSSEGTKGWYQYDQKEGTYQRFVMTTGDVVASGDTSNIENEGSDDKETFLDDFMSRQAQMICLLVFFGLCIILIIVVIVLAVKCSEYSGYDYYDPDDYYGQPEEDEREYVRTSSKGAVTAASIVEESMSEDEEPDGDDVEENEEESSSEEVAADGEESDDEADDMPKMNNPYEEMARRDRINQSRDSYEEEEDVEDDENYFDPRMSRKERKQYEKELRRQEKEAAREEKWRLKEEKKAAKMRNRGYEEASPMDWASFGEDMKDSDDDRRPVGRTKLPKYMEEADEEQDNIPQEEAVEVQEEEAKLPVRKINPELSEARAAESAKALKEDELRKKQKRLFEQQQRLEEQRRIEEEQLAEAQKMEQQKFIVGTRPEDEDLDEDFQFEFLDLK